MIEAFSNKSVYIWGANDRGLQIKSFLNNHKIDVTAFIDSRYNEVFFADIPCKNLEDIEKRPDIIVLAAKKKDTENEMLCLIDKADFHTRVITNSEFHNVEVMYECDRELGYEVNYEECLHKWFAGIFSEIEFWHRQVVQKSGRWHNTYEEKIKRKEFICSRLGNTIITDKTIILDVGCGICSQYGNIKDGREIQLIGVDPLAPFYNIINSNYFIKYNIQEHTPQVSFGMFELLSFFFTGVDIIIIDNALDHCFDPLAAIVETIKTLKVGGIASTFHRVDEAYNEGYSGLHQWNITGSDNEGLIAWNKGGYLNISDTLKEYAEFSIIKNEDANMAPFGTIICNIKKLKDIPSDMITNKRAGELLSVMMTKFADIEYIREIETVLRE